MSDDLVKRLREPLSQLPGDDDALMERVVSDRDEAATAIEEARAEIERLKVEADKYCEWWREERDKNATLRARVREVVGPFAKAGELFGHRLSEEYDQCIYRPAAGDEYSLCGDHLRAARQLMEEVK